jgi:hypothetical protein
MMAAMSRVVPSLDRFSKMVNT